MSDLQQNIIVTQTDLERLLAVVDQTNAPTAESLEAELHRAVVVGPREVPADVVTMNSELIYEDCDSHTQRRVTLVYPKDANAAEGKISVLAPIGSALLGLRKGQTIEWRVPNGTKHIRVVEICYQPEANGDVER